MFGWAAFLSAAAAPLAKRVLIGLGIGIVSYAALTTALNAALDAAKSALAGVPADVLSLLRLAGVTEAFAIIAGGLLAAVAVIATKKLGLVTGT